MATQRTKAFEGYANYRQNCINIAQSVRDRAITAANEKFDQEYAAAMTNEAQAREWYDTENSPTQEVSKL